MIERAGYPVEIIGFHAQQCREKATKAVLARHGIKYPFTHDLPGTRRPSTGQRVVVPEVVEQVPTLTPFAVVYRYEDLDLGDAPDLDELRDLVRQVHAWAAQVLRAAGS